MTIWSSKFDTQRAGKSIVLDDPLVICVGCSLGKADGHHERCEKSSNE